MGVADGVVPSDIVAVSTRLRVDCVNAVGISFEHDGIVVGTAAMPADPAEIEVLHSAWSESAERRVVTSTTLQAFLAMGSNARVVTYHSSFSPETIVARARSQLGRSGFGHAFAHWCVHGSATESLRAPPSAFSRQVFRYSAIGAALGLVAAMAMLNE